VGQPCRGVRVRIMDGPDEVKAGVEAEICVASPGVMQGYYNNPEATAQVLSPTAGSAPGTWASSTPRAIST